MRRFATISILLLFAVMNIALAAPVTQGQALSIAARFLAARHLPSAGLTLAGSPARLNATPSAAAPLYVFNAPQQGGYVIVAGDDRVPAVLGYSDSGTIDMDNAAPALMEWIAGYAAQIEALDADADLAAPLHATGTAVAPLLKTQWSQGNPYNILMPFVGSNQAVTGCVATAMAQVMYYHRWPLETTVTIPAYTTISNSIYMPELPVTTFDWADMNGNYLTDDLTSTGATAVAKLMLYCAQSVEMDFKSGGSGTSAIRCCTAMPAYFGYDPNIRMLYRKYIDTEEWENIIINELSHRRPVIYAGSNDGGHAFVCDGFDGNGMFHINWGWNGNGNGYFLLTVLNPYANRPTPQIDNWGYIESQRIITGIQPDHGGAFDLAVLARNFTSGVTSVTRTSSSDAFTFDVDCSFFNPNSRDISFDGGFGLFRDGRFIKALATFEYTRSLPPNYYITCSDMTLAIGGVDDGTYRIMPIYAQSGSNNWRPCLGAQGNCVEIVISGNTCTATGYGSAARHDYTFNGVTTSGTMFVDRPVRATVNLTNNGGSKGDMLYMFVDGIFTSTAMVDIEKDRSGNVTFQYWPWAEGTQTLCFSFSEDGSNAFGTKNVTITEMPTTDLSATCQVQNIIDTDNRIIGGKTFVVKATVTNNGRTTYDDDIVARIAKHTYDNYGTYVQTLTSHVTLAPHKSTTLQFEFDEVMDGWKYFAAISSYSAAELDKLKSTSFYTMLFPDEPQPANGDVNGDGEINIGDVNAVIDIILSGGFSPEADINGDGEVNIADVNAIIDILLS